MAIAVALVTATAACGTKVVVKEVVKVVPVEVIKEVPVPYVVEVIKEVPVPYVVEVIKEVPVEIVVEVPVIVEGTVSVPTIEVSGQATTPQASTVIATTGDQDTGPSATAQTEPEDTGPIRFYIGGHARLLSTLEGLIDVDPYEPVAKTFRIDILIDDQNRYYFTSDQPLVVPAGERVRFVVYNTHFTPDECW
jgi:hypothetical protein